MTRRPRHLLADAAALVAGAVLLVVGCGQDDSATTTTNPGPGPSTTEVPDEIYLQQADDISTTVQRYPDNVCVLQTASPEFLSIAGNPYQVQLSVEGTATWARAIASVSTPASAEALLAAAEDLEAAAAEQEYAPGFWESSAATELMSSAGVATALAEFEQRLTTECDGSQSTMIVGS